MGREKSGEKRGESPNNNPKMRASRMFSYFQKIDREVVLIKAHHLQSVCVPDTTTYHTRGMDAMSTLKNSTVPLRRKRLSRIKFCNYTQQRVV